MGYLPEAVLNYLCRLGWSHGDQEIFTREEAISVFSLEAINKAPARLDLNKLNDVNAFFIRQADTDRLFDLLHPWLDQAAGHSLGADVLDRIHAALPHMNAHMPSPRPALTRACARPVDPRPPQIRLIMTNILAIVIPSMQEKI